MCVFLVQFLHSMHTFLITKIVSLRNCEYMLKQQFGARSAVVGQEMAAGGTDAVGYTTGRPFRHLSMLPVTEEGNRCHDLCTTQFHFKLLFLITLFHY